MQILSVIGVTEADYETGFDVDISLGHDIKDVSMSVRTQLNIYEDNRILSVNMPIAYKKQDTLFFRYGVEVFFRVVDWDKGSNGMTDDDIRNDTDVKRLIDLTAGILRGAMAVRSNIQAKEYLQILYLPLFDINELAKRLRISRGCKL
jgi:hypothetical protein